MDISEELEVQSQIERDRMKEKAGFWNPKTLSRRQSYLAWLQKQANQRQKTLELDGVSHNKAMKDHLRRQKLMYEEEAKRIKDLIEDGR